MTFRIINQDFFTNTLESNSFDLIITDPPYKSFGNKLDGDLLNVTTMTKEFLRILKPDGQMIICCNFKLLTDLIYEFKNVNIPLQHLIVWDKRPTQAWISWGYPLRHVEYILFAGWGKLNFRTGKIKDPVKRSSFGGKLKTTYPNKNEVSYEMFNEIWAIKSVPSKKRIHPTQKPEQISERCKLICRDMNLKKIIDPFAGSGSLLSAFNKEPDLFDQILGFEINKEFI